MKNLKNAAGEKVLISKQNGKDLIILAEDKELVLLSEATPEQIAQAASGYICDECYNAIEEGQEIDWREHINPENEQKLCYGICHNDDEDINLHIFTKETAETTRFYDWTSELTDLLNRYEEDSYTTRQDIMEWAADMERRFPVEDQNLSWVDEAKRQISIVEDDMDDDLIAEKNA